MRRVFLTILALVGSFSLGGVFLAGEGIFDLVDNTRHDVCISG